MPNYTCEALFASLPAKFKRINILNVEDFNEEAANALLNKLMGF